MRLLRHADRLVLGRALLARRLLGLPERAPRQLRHLVRPAQRVDQGIQGVRRQAAAVLLQPLQLPVAQMVGDAGFGADPPDNAL